MLSILCAAKGFSASEFAGIVGCSKAWPANIMSGHQPPPESLDVLNLWADTLELVDAARRDYFLELARLAHAPEDVQERYWKYRDAARVPVPACVMITPPDTRGGSQ